MFETFFVLELQAILLSFTCVRRFVPPWADNVKQRIRAAKRYLKADYKLHVLDESPCADHCIRFALSSADVQYKSTCEHEHTMQCDRCLDCANVANDIITGLDSKDISFR